MLIFHPEVKIVEIERPVLVSVVTDRCLYGGAGSSLGNYCVDPKILIGEIIKYRNFGIKTLNSKLSGDGELLTFKNLVQLRCSIVRRIKTGTFLTKRK